MFYYLSPRKLRSYTIALASYVFYGWWRPDFVGLMLLSTVVDYSCGAGVKRKQEEGKTGRSFLIFSLVSNLGLLAYFKYANFGIDTLNNMLLSADMETVGWTQVILPVGISFYTFQTISYTVDIYMKRSEPVRAFRDMMCYVSMFPQLIAGPIVRYGSVAEQLHSRTHSLAKFYRGVLFFQCGFAKKLLIADVLAPLADQAFTMPELAIADAWIGVSAYAMQIYFDFSGYSDMAIGLGLMMGFSFPVNFNSPYRAKSITDFWRRWHISLSSFLRDYLYFPLGGNRRSELRTYFNLVVTMLLGGLWHGAAWTYICGGADQGFWLVVERLFGKKSIYHRAPRILRIAFTFVLVLFGWVFFRATDLGAALSYCGNMIGIREGLEPGLLHLRPIFACGGIAAVVLVWFTPTSQTLVRRAHPVYVLTLQFLFILALMHLHFESHVPFLYYQF